MIDRSPARPLFTVVRSDLTRATAAAVHALDGAVVAIGNFEGVHRGHRAVIDVARARARA
jgi:riboflavin kinase/FMN adenylyltransferase